MAKEFKEKTITVNLRKAFQKPATKRAISAKNMLKRAVQKETRLKETSISNKVNEEIWGRGKYNTPRKITIKIINEKGKAIILMPNEKYEAKKDKTNKKAKEKEEKIEIKKEKLPETKETKKEENETKKEKLPEIKATETKAGAKKEEKT